MLLKVSALLWPHTVLYILYKNSVLSVRNRLFLLRFAQMIALLPRSLQLLFVLLSGAFAFLSVRGRPRSRACIAGAKGLVFSGFTGAPIATVCEAANDSLHPFAIREVRTKQADS